VALEKPADTSVYASSATSRCRPQDSTRPEWIRYILVLYGSFIPYNMPVYPGAFPDKSSSRTLNFYCLLSHSFGGPPGQNAFSTCHFLDLRQRLAVLLFEPPEILSLRSRRF